MRSCNKPYNFACKLHLCMQTTNRKTTTVYANHTTLHANHTTLHANYKQEDLVVHFMDWNKTGLGFRDN